MSFKNPVFKTDERIRLGLWGLGRGMNFFQTCAELGFDVVAGCDFNEHMRRRFAQDCPNAFVTEDAEKFLDYDFDAVLLATYCPNHAEDAIRALKAGKHVLSEVTSFHTVAEGVKLVEEVEKSGLVYNLAENYPFSAVNMYLREKWQEGLFGDLMYAEYSYLHEVRTLQYTYIDGVPIEPGWTVHNWRSWIHGHYYNTHSLGPVMYITGLRPVRVVALPGARGLEGSICRDPRSKWNSPAPSLIKMSNGGLVRNLMGAMTDDTNIQRLWGTRGSAEWSGQGLRLRLGAAGEAPKMTVKPRWPFLGELAEKTGHGGGDFWVLYYFARQILTGEPAPCEIYTAADCTLQGIMAYRSAMENGQPYDIPDLRDRAQRERWRHDHFAQPRYDTQNGPFPRDADRALVGQFNTVMKELIPLATTYRAWADWSRVAEDLAEPGKMVELAERLLAALPKLRRIVPQARKIAEAYPDSDGARVLREMLALADAERTASEEFERELKGQVKATRADRG